MRSKLRDAGQKNGTYDSAWLRLRVHFDAVLLNPRAWATAVWWRVLGKKLRSRAQLAPLLGASPHAYRLWLLNEAQPLHEALHSRVDIVVIVAQGPGQDASLGSLEGQKARVLVLGSAEVETLADAAQLIDWSNNPWLLPLCAGDELASDAIDTYRGFAANARENVIYADDDLLDARGRRADPHFKPAWNAELFRCHDYLSGACIVRVSACDLAGLSSNKWPSELTAVAVQQVINNDDALATPARLPRVLHHRRERPIPQVCGPFDIGEGGLPKVSVIVPTRNRVDLLRTCLEGLARTDYPDMEIIVVDNGSDEPETLAFLEGLDPVRHQVLHYPGPFNFSMLNNRAAAVAKGALLCLLNNDIEMLRDDWLAIMARQALRPEVGAVGARLLYPDGRIQHAGVVLGICGGAAHAHRLLYPQDEGYFRRHALPQFVSAVTAACLVVQRKRFEAVGGLDEHNFAVAFNDVDLCMRLNAQGWQSLYEPRAILVHHESVSRGFDRDAVGAARMAGELKALKARWRTGDTEEEVDPYHHPQLSRFSERFTVRL